MKTFKLIKNLFQRHKPGCEYWIDIEEIIIPKYYKMLRINSHKWKQELQYWEDTGELKTGIRLYRNYILADGYISYLVAKNYDLGYVPVCFVE